MDETAFHGAQKRIDFLGRWALAFFAVATVLASWLGARYDAGKFGILFQLGVVCIVLVVIASLGLIRATRLRIKRLEEHEMTEETFALAGLILVGALVCGMGFFVLFLPQIDRLVEWWKKKRA